MAHNNGSQSRRRKVGTAKLSALRSRCAPWRRTIAVLWKPVRSVVIPHKGTAAAAALASAGRYDASAYSAKLWASGPPVVVDAEKVTRTNECVRDKGKSKPCFAADADATRPTGCPQPTTNKLHRTVVRLLAGWDGQRDGHRPVVRGRSEEAGNKIKAQAACDKSVLFAG